MGSSSILRKIESTHTTGQDSNGKDDACDNSTTSLKYNVEGVPQ